MERFGLPRYSINWVLRQPEREIEGEVGRCLTCGAFVYLPCIECLTNESPLLAFPPPADDCDVSLDGEELERYKAIKAKKDAAVREGDKEYAWREQRLLDIEKECDEFFNEGANVVVPE